MKGLFRKAVVTLWIGLFTVLLTRHWYQEPDSFPPILRSFGNWLIDKTRVNGADQVGAIESLFVVSVALSIALITTWFLFAVITMLKK